MKAKVEREKVVALIRKSPIEEVRFSIKRFVGKDYFDIRIYYKEHYQFWLATRKGISLKIETFNEFKQAIILLEKELSKR